jgi:hypothetical protein
MRTRIAEVLGDTRQRRWAYVIMAAVLALLCVVPRPYVARAKVSPQDISSIGLGSMLGGVGAQFQGLASLLGGGRQPVDMYLAVSRSIETTDDVIRSLNLVGPSGYASVDDARRALDRKVDIHSLTGGIIEVEVRTREAEALTGAYVKAISRRLVSLGRERVERKRKVVLDRFKEAAARVTTSEAKLNEFRLRNRIAEPQSELGAAVQIRAGLEAQLQAKLVELRIAQEFKGPENPQFVALQAEIATLRDQLARTTKPDEGAGGPNAAGLSAISGDYLNLYRDYRFSQALYEVYARTSEEVAVESLAGETASDVQVIEAPRIDVDRKYNISAVALLALVILTALFTELYAPATGIVLPFARKTD